LEDSTPEETDMAMEDLGCLQAACRASTTGSTILSSRFAVGTSAEVTESALLKLTGWAEAVRVFYEKLAARKKWVPKKGLTRVEAMALFEERLARADVSMLAHRALISFRTISLEAHRDFISDRTASRPEATL
jgi:hypothetical protein